MLVYTCFPVFSPFSAPFYPPLHHNGKGSIPNELSSEVPAVHSSPQVIAGARDDVIVSLFLLPTEERAKHCFVRLVSSVAC